MLKIEESLNYKFNNSELLNEAISLNNTLVKLGQDILNTHISLKLTKELSIINNGNLEFYYSNDVINNLKTKLLSKEYLESIINKLKLNDIIDNPLENNLFMLALIGALSLDIEDTNSLSNIIDNYLNIDDEMIFGIENDINYPELVLEWDKRKNKDVPKYSVTKNNEIYLAEVKINIFDKSFNGNANTKIVAIIEAFKNAYKYLEENDLLLKITDIVKVADSENCVNQLQELYLKGFIKEPVYKIGLKGSKGGVDIWKCRILIDGIRESFSGEDTSKKTAKRLAAYQMVEYILKNA